MKKLFLGAAVLLLLSVLTIPLSTVFAQGTAFTYQGRLNSGLVPANGSYDLMFTVFATNTAGVAVAGPVTNSAIAVTNGLFTTLVDFGPAVFTGTSNWLEVAVRTNGGAGFTPLAPRTPVTPTPYAIYAASAGNAVSASTATSANSISATNIMGIIGDASLSTNVALRTGGNIFSGNQIVTSGSVGIGLTNPSRIFQIRSGTDRVLSLFQGGQASGVGIESVNDANSANQMLEIRANPTVYTQGNVGIGTLNPVSALQVAGTVTANLYSGDGSALANLNASNLVSGTVADPRLSANVALRAGGNVFSGNQLLTNGSVGIGLTNPTRIFQIRAGTNRVLSLFEGGQASGVGIESVNDAGSANQMLEIRANPTVFTQGGVGIGTLNPTTALEVSGTITATSFSGNGSGLLNLNPYNLASGGAGAQLYLTNPFNIYNGFYSGYFNGNGSGLTNLNPNSLANGGAGAQLYLTNSFNIYNGFYSGYFNGNGSGLTNLSPNSLANGGAGAQLYLTNAFNIYNGFYSGYFNGNGSGLTNLSPNSLASGGAGAQIYLTNAFNIYNGFYSGYFNGNGSGLTNLNPYNLLSGGAGAQLYLTNSFNIYNGFYSGYFNGNGSGLTNLNPNSLASGGTGAQLYLTNSFNNINGQFNGYYNGNGAGLTNLPVNGVTGGLTINLAVLVPGGGTNILCFTNGILRAIQ